MEQQRTDQWFERRRGLVTGSNVGAILGVDPYRTANDVMRQMVREYHGAEREFKGNPATQWGVNNEDNAIFELEIEHNLKVVETGFHSKGWIGASPDGLIGDDAVGEIKCPYGLRNEGEFKTAEEQPHYHAQMQIEMYSTDTDKCYFFQWTPRHSKLEIVERCDEWLAINIPILKAFHDKFLVEVNNPIYLEDKVKKIKAKELSDAYRAADMAMKNSKKLFEEAKEALIERAGGKNCDIDGLKVSRVNKKGSVSYSKVVGDHCKDIDLEPCRGKPSEYWMVK